MKRKSIRILNDDDDGAMNFDCYYCENCKTNIQDEYERHVITKHPGKPSYPEKADLEKLGIVGRGRRREI